MFLIPLFPSSLPSCDKCGHMSLETIKISANAPVLPVIFPKELHGNLIFIFDPKGARGSTLSSASFKMGNFTGTDKFVGKLFWETNSRSLGLHSVSVSCSCLECNSSMGAWGTDVAGKKRYKLQLAMARRSLLLEVLLFECMVLWQEDSAGKVSLRRLY